MDPTCRIEGMHCGTCVGHRQTAVQALAPAATHIAAILLMGGSSLAVMAALQRRQQIRCACLGSVLKLSMSTITLGEALGMAAMAAMALLHGV